MPGTSLQISGMGWHLREKDFLRDFMTIGETLQWGHTGIIAINIPRDFNWGGNLKGTMFIRFVDRDPGIHWEIQRSHCRHKADSGGVCSK